MPPSDTPDERRGGKLLTVLFWAGVGLAPLAALLLLVGQGGGPLRVAAVLAVLAVVLIGLSITLRRDSESVRLDLEETLLDEVDLLREDVRADITTAARATHRALSEKLQALHDTVEAMRGQVEAAAHAGLPRGGYEPAESRAGSPRPPAVAATARTNGSHQQPAPRLAQHGGNPASVQPGVASGLQPGVAVAGVAMPAGGVVRHTETVHVTTRQTIVDQHGGEDGRGNGFGDAGRANSYGDAGRANGYGAVNGYPDPTRPDTHADQRIGGHAAGVAGVAGVLGAVYSRSAEQPAAVRPSSAMPSSAMPSSAMPSSAIPSSAMPSSGMPGGGRHGDWSGQPRGRVPQHGEGSWSHQRQREWAPDPQGNGFHGADPGAGFHGADTQRTGFHGADPGAGFHGADPGAGFHGADTQGAGFHGADTQGAGFHGADSRVIDPRDAAGPRRPRPPEQGGEEGWSDVRAADRWASVRTDDRGREMRMGERRAAVHTDQSGTELRVEDRWASVRQQDPRQRESRHQEPRQQEPRWEDPQRGQPQWQEPRSDEWRREEGHRSDERRADPRQHPDQWAAQPGQQWSQEPPAGRGQEAAWSQPRWEQDRAGGQPALPAAPAEPATGWSQGWAQPDPAPAGGGRRRRAEPDEDQYGYRIVPQDGPPPARARRVDFGPSDERWR